MAIYHLSAKPIKRSAGRSSVAAAAYRSGEQIVDERTGLTHNYTRRSRTEIETWVAAPEGAPEWSRNRAELWNAVEANERRKDSRTAHELEVALPSELGPEAQRDLVERYVAEHLTSRGLVADVSIHRDKDRNPHAHIMATTRGVGPEGFGAKDRDLDRKHTLDRWREGWAEHANEHLREAGREERIDHRSHAERGIEREPQIHEGPAVREMEQRGIRTAKADANRNRYPAREPRRERQPEREPEPQPRRRRRRQPEQEHDMDREI